MIDLCHNAGNPPVIAVLQSKAPHRSWWLSLNWDKNHPPRDVIAALAEIGWKADQAKPLDMLEREAQDFFKDGSDLFKAWTAAEGQRFTRELNTVLAWHGLHAPKQKLSLADMM